MNMSKVTAIKKLTGAPHNPPANASDDLMRQTEFEAATDCAVIYASLLSVGREEDAQAAADATFAVHDSPMVRAIFVVTCLDAKQLRPVHREWAKQADPTLQMKDTGKTLAQLVDEALTPQK